MVLKEIFKEFREKRAKERVQRQELESTRISALQKARLEQAAILGKQQAIIEREERVKRLRERASQGGGGGFIESAARRINIAARNLGYDQRQQQVPKFAGKKGKKGKRTETIIVGGKKFQRIISEKSRKKQRNIQRRPQAPQRMNVFETSL